METLKNLNKLWRNSALLSSTTTYHDAAAAADRVYSNKEVLFDDEDEEGKEANEEEEEEEEESFFELKLVMLNRKTIDKEDGGLRPTANEVNVGRRVEPHLKTHGQHHNSPVSILKSAPKFKVSLFRKHRNNSNWPDLKLKLKQGPRVDDEEKENVSSATISTLIRESSTTNNPVSKQSMSKCKTEEEDSVSADSSSSKRFSKDVMHKYLKLKLIKPFHLKVAKRCASVNNNKSSTLFEAKDCSSSPAPSSSTTSSSSSSSGYGLRVVCRQLGKSRSASSMMAVGSRRDESLMVEHDDGGVQSAILHCKRSFNSSSGSGSSSQ